MESGKFYLKKAKMIFGRSHFRKAPFQHKDLFKVRVWSENGEQDRLPAYLTRAVQDEESKEFKAQYWKPQQFKWNKKSIKINGKTPVICECHIGMAQEKEGVGTYKEFEKEVVPRIKKLDITTYNVWPLWSIHIMVLLATMCPIFAASSRFGAPERAKIFNQHLS